MQAIAAYEKAAEAAPGDVSPYLGLAQAYQSLDRPNDVLSAHRQAAALAAGDKGVIAYLAAEMDVNPSVVLDYLARGESYQTQAGADMTYSLLDHLDDTQKLLDESVQVYRTAFVIERIPKGVLFQHPPSRTTYQLQVPARAKLEFSLALAPEVWQLEKVMACTLRSNSRTSLASLMISIPNTLTPRT